MPKYRMFPLVREETADGAFVVLFGPDYINLLQNGSLVTKELREVDVVGNALDINPSVEPEPFDGQFIYVEAAGGVFVAKHAGSSILIQNKYEEPISIPGTSTKWAPVVTLNNPYAVEEFYEIGYAQADGALYFAHHNHPPRVLSFTKEFGWRLREHYRDEGKPLSEKLYKISVEDTGKFIEYVRIKATGSGYDESTDIVVDDPTGTGAELVATVQEGGIVAVDILEPGQNYTDPTITTEGPGSGAEFEVGLSETNAGLVVAVSAVIDGEETGIMRPTVARGIVDFTQVKGSATYSWTEVPGAEKYRVYRSLVFPEYEDAHIGYTLGFIGETIGTSLTDINIQPDFTDTPIIYNDPFAPGAVKSFEILDGGSGYNPTDRVKVVDGGDVEALEYVGGGPIKLLSGETMLTSYGVGSGEGFIGYPIVRRGSIIGVYIAHHGRNYETPNLIVECVEPSEDAPTGDKGDENTGKPSEPRKLDVLKNAFNLPREPDEDYQVLVFDGSYGAAEVGNEYELELEDGTKYQITLRQIIYDPENDVTRWRYEPTIPRFPRQTVILREPAQFVFVSGDPWDLFTGNPFELVT